MAVGFWGITVAQFSVPGQKGYCLSGGSGEKKNGKKWKKRHFRPPRGELVDFRLEDDNSNLWWSKFHRIF